MCKCKSYNRKVKGAKHPNVILEVPKRLRTKRWDGTEQRTIAVDKCIIDSFSLGVVDKRYPKNDKVLLRFMSLEFTEESEFDEAKIIRVK